MQWPIFTGILTRSTGWGWVASPHPPPRVTASLVSCYVDEAFRFPLVHFQVISWVPFHHCWMLTIRLRWRPFRFVMPWISFNFCLQLAWYRLIFSDFKGNLEKHAARIYATVWTLSRNDQSMLSWSKYKVCSWNWRNLRHIFSYLIASNSKKFYHYL